MTTTRTYEGRPQFSFRCDACDAYLEVGLDVLAARRTFDCYGCGAVVDVPNAVDLARLGREAAAALKALHQEMDDCPTFNRVRLLGGASMTKITWSE